MPKMNGLGQRLLVGGYDISGDIQALDNVHGGPALLDMTDITQSAHARIGGLRDGGMGATVFFDPANAHPVLKVLPTADVAALYLLGTSLGSAAACCVAKQIGYDPTRGTDGGLLLKTQFDANGYGLEWAQTLTAGLRTDVAAANGASLDTVSADPYGAQAYLQVTGFTGTSVTVTVQQSADNSTWITLAAFTAVAAAPAWQRITTVAPQSFTATSASPCVFTVPGSAPANGTPVALAGTALPAGFTAGTVYYVVASSGSTFELSATSGGSAINSTSAGSGTVTPAVLRYVRVITAGTFTSATFAAALNINQAPVSF